MMLKLHCLTFLYIKISSTLALAYTKEEVQKLKTETLPTFFSKLIAIFQKTSTHKPPEG